MIGGAVLQPLRVLFQRVRQDALAQLSHNRTNSITAAQSEKELQDP
jgi:hypothetical protein